MQETSDMVTFTEENLNRKLPFFVQGEFIYLVDFDSNLS